MGSVKVQEHYGDPFKVFGELQIKYGEPEEVNVCDSLVGNVSVKFQRRSVQGKPWLKSMSAGSTGGL